MTKSFARLRRAELGDGLSRKVTSTDLDVYLSESDSQRRGVPSRRRSADIAAGS